MLSFLFGFLHRIADGTGFILLNSGNFNEYSVFCNWFVNDFSRVFIFWIFKNQLFFDFDVVLKSDGFVIVLPFNSRNIQ